MVRKAETFPPVTTMGHIRRHGCRDLPNCSSGRCHHSATLNGMIGADVRPDRSPHVNKRHV
jgi:hypothetical protein